MMKSGAMRRGLGVLVLLLASVSIGAAQERTGQPAPSNIQGGMFPRINTDGTVTFRVRADQAQTVVIKLPDFGDIATAKGDEGFWWGTSEKPVPPGFYYYTVDVDGFASNDPGTRPFYGWNRWSSALEVPGPDSTLFELRDVPRGVVREQWYYSKTMQQWRPIRVYTPPGYDTEPTRRYPVLYLQHGSGENQTSWTNQGHAQFILDNLLAEGRIVPMVVVNENGMMPPSATPARGTGAAPGGGRGGSAAANRFAEIVTGDLIPFVDANYRTIATRESRAIAGLSMGGGQALNIGVNHLNLFNAVGLFSPAVRNLDPATAYDGKLADAAAFNKRLGLLWIGIGRGDFLYDAVKATHENLEKAGIRHTWVESEGLHTWPVWRRHLAEFAPLLFRN